MNATTENAPTRKMMFSEEVRRGKMTEYLRSNRSKIIATNAIAKNTINPACLNKGFLPKRGELMTLMAYTRLKDYCISDLRPFGGKE
jgi:hypothetical protein